ncbi:IclR family transcriptional regulator [Mycolicibacterium fortuitum]|uniref:IclR family transcriptional regulator n=1 Tax=Mycolicibacterium fortuitum TaxID=1766 RepID=A0ABD6QJK8_MYCFO|nr:IclR family transcriptional regulator [Mycolicibacterium fortuitum]OMC39542.1 IclR family transcriptional regulator [Mycolicibacterium fortuitum]
MSRTHTGESSLARAIRVLAAFGPDETALTVSAIARRSDLHIATASRIVGELVSHGLLERGANREIRIGVRLWELAARASPTLTLHQAAMPFMADIHAVVNQHVQLGVLDGDDVLFIERLSARDAVINYSRIAGRLPLHASASGHVLLAYGTAELQDRILAGPLAPYTDQTITRPDVLRRALDDIAGRGYALLRGHIHPAAAGLAVPVSDPMNHVVAALSVIVPNDDHAAGNVPLLLAAARGIRRALKPDPVWGV